MLSFVGYLISQIFVPTPSTDLIISGKVTFKPSGKYSPTSTEVDTHGQI